MMEAQQEGLTEERDMSKVYERTENGVVTHVSREAGLAEINEAMIGRAVRERSTRTMSSLSRTDYRIVCRDGREVTLKLVEEPARVDTERTALIQRREDGDHIMGRVVTVKGKDYVVGTVTGGSYVHYWSERDGERFGATRSASASRKPGTVGRAIWDAIKPR
jgi:hypothetical protein